MEIMEASMRNGSMDDTMKSHPNKSDESYRHKMAADPHHFTSGGSELFSSSSKLGRLCTSFQELACVKYWLISENPLSENPSTWDKIRWYVMCPPHGNLGWVLTRVIGIFIAWAALYGIVGQSSAASESNLFILYVTSRLSGFLISKAKLPPLLGMLLAGILLNNLTNVTSQIESYWKVVLRDISFITILIRAGLSLNPKGLIQMKNVVVRLAFCPGVGAEGPTVALIAYFLLDLPIDWSLLLGFVLAAVSPAVVVPSLLGLQSKGYGVDQGVPTLIIAAASIDDIIAISAFSVTLSITSAEKGSSLYLDILRAPLEVIIGVTAALIIGFIFWYIPPPAKNQVDRRGHPLNKMQDHTAARFLLLFGAGIMFMFCARKFHLAGAGALGTLAVAFVTGLGWDLKTKMPVGEAFGHAWNSLMPLLFGLIGSEINLSIIDGSVIGGAIACIVGGLVVRFLVTFLVVFGAGLNLKERLFVAIAWIPKATVQAAMGSIPLDTARELLMEDLSEEAEAQARRQERFGITVITVAVVAILISAPLGAIGISLTGKKLLRQPVKPWSKKSMRKNSTVTREDGQPRPLNTPSANNTRNFSDDEAEDEGEGEGEGEELEEVKSAGNGAIPKKAEGEDEDEEGTTVTLPPKPTDDVNTSHC